MSAAVVRLILLISCAHALVHVYELAFPPVEQLIAAENKVGTKEMGELGTCWRLPFGAFAIFAGWLTDRFGAKRMLIAYLAGCSVTAMLVAMCYKLTWLFVAFFCMGTFASIYHPAGLALISHVTTPWDRPRALGMHGILGSFGIAGAPLVAGTVLGLGASWRGYYLVLSVPGLLLAALFALRLTDPTRGPTAHTADRPNDGEDDFHVAPYVIILAIGTIVGFVYAATMNFLPRYLSESQVTVFDLPQASISNYLAAGVLVLGAVGQYSSGRLARPQSLERFLTAIIAAIVPCLAMMAVAQGSMRIVAAGFFAVIFFMTQPLTNSLIAKYVPARRRSLGYGINFMLAFGIGSFGAAFAGYIQTMRTNYLTLAALAAVGAVLSVVLWSRTSRCDLP